MKIFVSANEKGGVGKSAMADQFAWYLADVRNQRTLVIDTDQQAPDFVAQPVMCPTGLEAAPAPRSLWVTLGT